MQPLPCSFIISDMEGRHRDRLDTQVVKSQAAKRPVLFLRSQPSQPSSSKGFLSLGNAVADLLLFVFHSSASEICIPYL